MAYEKHVRTEYSKRDFNKKCFMKLKIKWIEKKTGAIFYEWSQTETCIFNLMEFYWASLFYDDVSISVMTRRKQLDLN